jgi:uncharacterized delta-60 repeat protein
MRLSPTRTRLLSVRPEVLESRVLFAGGDLDTTFGSGGFARADLGDGTAYGADLVVDAARGRVLVSGVLAPAVRSRFTAVSPRTRGALAAFKLDGRPDTTFSADGKLLTDLPNLGGLHLLPDGRFYASYTARYATATTPGLAGVARFKPDGSYDTTFSGDGKMELPFGGAVATAPGGKLVLVETRGGPIRVARFNADGTPDTTFGGDGVVTVDYSAQEPPPQSEDDYRDHWLYTADAAVQPDGRIVIVGTAYTEDQWDGAAMRLTADGTFDTTFAGDGTLIVSTGSVDDFADAVALQPDGKILVGVVYSEYEAYPVRLNPNGTFDSFNASQRVEGEDPTTYDIHVASDGRVIISGEYEGWTEDRPNAFLASYLPGGQMQGGFGGYGTGRVVNPIGTQSDLAPDDKILVLGSGGDPAGVLTVARYLDEGGADTSGSAGFAGGTLSVTGTGRDDQIELRPGAAAGQVLLRVNGYERRYSGVTGVVVNGGAGDDDVRVDRQFTFPATLAGGAGDDELHGGAGHDRLDGGEGSDGLVGWEGHDQLLGGPGTDNLYGVDGNDELSGGPDFDYLNGGLGADDISGGDGRDYLTYADRERGVRVDQDGVGDDGELNEGDNVRPDVEMIEGGTGDDYIEGTGADNDFRGNAGDDTLVGNGGNDTLGGGGGLDSLLGGDGDDELAGSGTLRGGNGNDVLWTGGTADDVDGGPGLDVINGVRDDGVPTTGPIALDPPSGTVAVTGDSGNDVIRVSYVSGPTPIIRVDVQYGATDYRPASSRRVDFPFSDVRLISVGGGAGDDVIDLTGVPGPALLSGHDGNDLVRGGDAGDTLLGGPGNDRLFGNAGDDTFDAAFDTGSDTYHGGAGADRADYSARADDLVVTLNNRAGDGARGERDDVRDDVEDVTGGSGDDRISGSAANNRLTGGAGNDTLSGGAGKDQLRGQAGNDLLLAAGDGEVDFLDGGSGTDRARKDSNDFAQYVEQILA